MRVRIIVATFEADYTGRLTTRLPEAKRVILIKGDGSVLIHSETNSFKPVNWMPAPCSLEEFDDQWVVTNRKGETLTLSFTKIHSDRKIRLGDEPGLTKEGVEDDVQAFLASHMSLFGENVTLIRREYPTPIGPVDLLARDDEGVFAVEVKRKGGLNGVEQLSRYLEFLNEDVELAPVRGVYAALSFTPQAVTLAEHRGLTVVPIDRQDVLDWLQNTEGSSDSGNPRLF